MAWQIDTSNIYRINLKFLFYFTILISLFKLFLIFSMNISLLLEHEIMLFLNFSINFNVKIIILKYVNIY